MDDHGGDVGGDSLFLFGGSCLLIVAVCILYLVGLPLGWW